MWQNLWTYFLGSFLCKNIRSIQFTSISSSDLAIAHTRKYFSYQLLSQIAFFWMRTCSCIMCIPRSCDCNVNVCHVQPPLLPTHPHGTGWSLHSIVYIASPKLNTWIHVGIAIDVISGKLWQGFSCELVILCKFTTHQYFFHALSHYAEAPVITK